MTFDRVLKNNKLNGTLDIGTSFSNNLQLIDLRQNRITEYTNKEFRHKLMYVLL